MSAHDLLGRPVTPEDAELLEIYQALKRIAARGDTAPCVDRNVKQALACLWQVVNDLNLEYEQVYDAGV